MSGILQAARVNTVICIKQRPLKLHLTSYAHQAPVRGQVVAQSKQNTCFKQHVVHLTILAIRQLGFNDAADTGLSLSPDERANTQRISHCVFPHSCPAVGVLRSVCSKTRARIHVCQLRATTLLCCPRGGYSKLPLKCFMREADGQPAGKI